MPDINKALSQVQKESKDLRNRIRRLLGNYENLHREATRALREERTANGGMDGLEEFYRFVRVIQRNRDVIGSLMRGVGSLRPIEQFTVIEENLPEKEQVQEDISIPDDFQLPTEGVTADNG